MFWAYPCDTSLHVESRYLFIIDLGTLRDGGGLLLHLGWLVFHFLVILVMTGNGCDLFLNSVLMACLFL